MSSGLRVALVALLVLATAGVLAGTTASPAGATGPAPAVGDEPRVTADVNDTVNTSLRLDLRPNGDARWTVTAEFEPTNEAERAAFRQDAEAFENGETTGLGLGAFRQALAEVEPTTNRSMEITVQQRSADTTELDNGTGTLAVSFTWTNFARADGDRLVLADVFNGTRGLWLSELGADQRLEVHPPSGYGVIDAKVAPEERGSLIWHGPQTFQSGDLNAIFAGSAGPGEPGGSDDGVLGTLLPVLGGLLVVALLVGLAYAYRDRLEDALPEPGPAAPDADGVSENGDSPTAADADGTVENGEAVAAEAGAAEGGSDPELLSDEERVERLLEDNGGRMKQARIVKETGWSNAKVSQLLSTMDDDDRIDKLRIGRENLISFPDEEITDIEE